MSIARTLNRLVAEVRREARRNPDFAARLDAVLRAHVWRGAASGGEAVVEAAPASAPVAAPAAPATATQTDLNPIAYFSREGADALKAVLADLSDPALKHLVGEHHLDPAGATDGLGKEDLVAHIVAQARKRVERDRKMFDY